MQMLYPTKHAHPDLTVLAVSAALLKRLRNKRVESFSDLYKFVQSSTPGSEALFEASITFLFALGLIEYRTKTDAFEFLGTE
jgi:hypothetical protein